MQYLVDFQSVFIEADSMEEAHTKADELIREQDVKVDIIQQWED